MDVRLEGVSAKDVNALLMAAELASLEEDVTDEEGLSRYLFWRRGCLLELPSFSRPFNIDEDLHRNSVLVCE